uniref:Zinc finger PHD-type domain-containing protein n=1 Tax=Romanomermis culicivorax TaxID=13658 RepID=A0A915LDE4_ROMCU
MPKSQIDDHEDSSSDDDDESIADCLFHDPVCHKCEEAIVNRDQLISCAGGCFRRFHKACVENHIHNNVFTCFVCLLGGNWCFLCKTQIVSADHSETCQISSCKNRFHASCIQNLEEKSDRRFVCAHHYCLTCSIEVRNPTCGTFLACIKCPSAYHKHDRCIPAGTILLNTRWIICTEHKKEASQKKSANVNFCFVCGL